MSVLLHALWAIPIFIVTAFIISAFWELCHTEESDGVFLVFLVVLFAVWIDAILFHAWTGWPQ